MTNENLERVRNRYNKLVELKEQIENAKKMNEQLLKRKSELEENEFVKEYLTILKQLNEAHEYLALERYFIPNTDQEMLRDAATEVSLQYCYDDTENREEKLANSTNHIYVYMGSFKYDSESDIVHGPGVIQVPDDNPNFSWKDYKDIELTNSDATQQIYKHNVEKFEAENTILYAPEDMDPRDFYDQVRLIFFETAIKESQEEAVRKVKTIGK